MKKLNLKMLAMLFVAFVMSATFVSCDDDDDPVLQGPSVTAPGTQEILTGSEVDLTFNYTAPAGFKSSNVQAENGTATVKTDGAGDATSGEIVVTFTASDNTGAGSVKVSVTDKNDQTDDATAVVNVVAEQTTFLVNSNITEDATWETGKVYILQSRIAVVDGVTLTIEPGVIVKGEAGTGTNATALLIAQGAKLMAEGTADAPIIFTSIADEITPEQVAGGDFKSPNLDLTANGYWGGILVMGKAPISVAEGNTAQIEGIPSTDENGLYGGDDPGDNSGVLKYISIRHGGSNIGEGNEINGLTLGGVGSGTVIENIEVVANQDDAIEWFGGTVDVKNAIVVYPGDDGMDADQGWNGTCDNFVVIASDDHLFELDGIEGDKNDPAVIAEFGAYTYKNGYVIANTDAVTSSDLINLDPETYVHFENIFFTAIEDGQQITLKGDLTLPDDFLEGVETSFTDVVLNVADVAPHIDGTAPGVSAGTSPANSSAINLSAFSWTWAQQAGLIVAW